MSGLWKLSWGNPKYDESKTMAYGRGHSHTYDIYYYYYYIKFSMWTKIVGLRGLDPGALHLFTIFTVSWGLGFLLDLKHKGPRHHHHDNNNLLPYYCYHELLFWKCRPVGLVFLCPSHKTLSLPNPNNNSARVCLSPLATTTLRPTPCKWLLFLSSFPFIDT